jgi:glycolate oxidase FAD binding subunit
MTGSFGTLAALTSITFKVLPRAEVEETLVLEGLSDAEAIAAMGLAMQSSCEVSAAAHLPGALAQGGAKTFLRLEGVSPSVAYRRDKLLGLVTSGKPHHLLGDDESRAAWIAIRDVHPLADHAERCLWRLSVPPADGARTVAAIASAHDMRWFYDWAGGLVWLDLPPSADASASLIRAAINEGHATLFRAGEAVRASVPVFQPQPLALAALARRVKHAFDPLGILNPGRMSSEV